jgi:hypothetical protein
MNVFFHHVADLASERPFCSDNEYPLFSFHNFFDYGGIVTIARKQDKAMICFEMQQQLSGNLHIKVAFADQDVGFLLSYQVFLMERFPLVFSKMASFPQKHGHILLSW